MQDKKLLKDNEELDIADVTEYARYSMEIERTFAELQKGFVKCVVQPGDKLQNKSRVR